MPTEMGTCWVNLTVSDGDSGDSFNWTVSVCTVPPSEDDVIPVDDDEQAPPEDETPADDPLPA